MKNIEEDIRKIKQIIDDVKPKYTSFGGDIQFVDIKGKDVRIKPTGYCYRWHATRIDLVQVLEERVKAEVPWVEMVIITQ